ncbi:CD1871A family CXXC motif-containing protein [Lachnoclostridium phytofermentans]|nr:CD1871A family CXXC motif-containing protein [Lachnoclostridium phytofermentans]
MKNKLPIFLFFSAITLIGIGAFRGEALEVLNKGINLCLECVGIG